MRNQAVSNLGQHSLHRILGIAALALLSGILPRLVFAQSATGGSAIKIGIIGSGNMGSTLGTLWVKSGHPVLFSSRHPEQLKKLADGLGPLARAGTVEEEIGRASV